MFWPFWKSKQKQFHVWDLYKTSKSAKKWSSIFGLIEETMDDLSCILLTVQWHLFFFLCVVLVCLVEISANKPLFYDPLFVLKVRESQMRVFYDSFYLDIFLLMKFIHLQFPQWTIFWVFSQLYHKGLSINYVVSVREGGSSKDDLLHRPYFKKRRQGVGSKIADFKMTLFMDGP